MYGAKFLVTFQFLLVIFIFLVISFSMSMIFESISNLHYFKWFEQALYELNKSLLCLEFGFS